MNKILTVFIVLIVGLVLLPVLGQKSTDMRTTGTVTNESLTIAAANTATDLVNDDLISVSAVRNITTGSAIPAGDYIVDTTNGQITLNTTATLGVDYTYFPDDYVKDGTSRNLIPLIILFFVLALIGAGAWILRDSELFNMAKK